MNRFVMPVNTPRLLRARARHSLVRSLAVLGVLAILSNVMFLGSNQPGGDVLATGDVSEELQASLASASSGNGAVCPAGNVKYEVDESGYEYTDNSATVALTPDNDQGKNAVTWAAASGETLESVCVKIGGPDGGSLQYPDVSTGQAGPYEYDISHVVVRTTADEPPGGVTNPPLGQSCGLDIGLIVDTSGSMNSSEMTQVKSALTGFASAFAGTPTQFSLTTFATNATVKQPFPLSAAQVSTAIATDVPAVGSGNTNWDAGLTKSFSTFDPRPAKPNLMVIATDGSPNRFGDPATATFSWSEGLNHAITTANTIKSAGTRILVIGIGADQTDPDYPNTDPKLQAISGPDMAPPGAISVSTDVVKTDFAQLGTALSELAQSLCGGKIIVQKQFDTNGDGQADIDGGTPNPLLSNWQFTLTGSPSQPAPQTTTNTGALEFPVQAGSYTLTETARADTVMVAAACRQGEQPVGTVNLATRSISGLVADDQSTITCTVVNTSTLGTLTVKKQVVGSTTPASSWQLHVKRDGQDVTNSPQPGSSSGHVYFLEPGQYAVSETGPSGYTAAFSAGCPSGNVTIAANQNVTCTITNTKIPEPQYAIRVDKTGPETVVAGNDILYAINWWVDGDAPVTQATITDVIPAHTSWVWADNFGAHNGNQVTWNLGNKSAGAHGVVYLIVHADVPVTNGTVVTNTATFDTAQTNPVSDSAQTTIQSHPTIGLDKQAPATLDASQQLTYTLKWEIGGTAPATDVVLTDPVPANTTFVTADNGGTLLNGVVTWNLGTKLPGNKGTVTMTVKATTPIASGTVITNTATLDTTETNPVSDTATTTLTSAPKLSITKTNNVATFTSPGQAVTYTVTVSNANGTNTAQNVVLTDTLPAGFTFTDGGGSVGTFNLGSIAPGSSVIKTYAVNIGSSQATGIYANVAAAQGTNATQVTATSNVDVRIPSVLGATAEPALSISKTADRTSATLGDVIVYTITVKNTGNAPAHNVVIADALPNGMVNLTTGLAENSWEFDLINPGESKSVSFPVTITAKVRAGKATNTAMAKADGVDAVKAKFTVTVRQPQVLGLATTGVGPRDYAIMGLGLLLVVTGAILLRRQYRQPRPF